jgi:hypothetical protein
VRSAWPVYVEVGNEAIGFGAGAAGDAACTIEATDTDDDIDNDETLLGANTAVGLPDDSVTDSVEDSVPVSSIPPVSDGPVPVSVGLVVFTNLRP